MNLLALILDPQSPSTRYRVAYLAPYLEQRGWRTEVRAVPSGWRRRACWQDAAAYDAVLVQKQLLQPWEWRRLRRTCRRLIFDFDDALPIGERGEAAGRTSMRYWKFRAAATTPDLVLAGNSYLAELAAPYARHIAVQPTGLPVERYEPAPHRDRSQPRLVLGWIGSRSTLPYLEAILPILEELHRRHPQTRLKVVADRFPHSASLPIDATPWSEAREAGEVASFDIGLMPLPDNRWTRGKCGLKILQYLAAGVPVVCSPVGVNTSIVRDDLSGYFARNASEWLEHLQRLIAQPELRARLGAWGRKDVEERFSSAAMARQLADHLDRLVGAGVDAGGEAHG